jgi:hypothetical protein
MTLSLPLVNIFSLTLNKKKKKEEEEASITLVSKLLLMIFNI